MKIQAAKMVCIILEKYLTVLDDCEGISGEE